MRTNIDIDDELMARAMEAGGFKTKREAVEEGLRLLARRKVYADLLAARGTLHWDDSDEGWAQYRKELEAAAALATSEGAQKSHSVQEPPGPWNPNPAGGKAGGTKDEQQGGGT
ncbi:type II toxin-antitoxin system VapB family antitoxin [Extensimonas perlucida]|jgi:Transcription regulator of the Arc/MetJ class|uniref:type II toxin-antitoxin system VapB family antitoxin n=1 Tax=Extensimonas perlucida TaxID=2590786 RepID=UPI0011A7152B|nr:type II toxin-antitoxin system VapB family antitoxin [Extensimonas perlucida]